MHLPRAPLLILYYFKATVSSDTREKGDEASLAKAPFEEPVKQVECSIVE